MAKGITRNDEEMAMLASYRVQERKHARNFSTGFHKTIGKPFFDLLKTAGAKQTGAYQDDDVIVATICHFASDKIQFTDSEDRPHRLDLATTRERFHWEVYPLPPFILPPHRLKRQIIQADITLEPHDSYHRTASLSALTYADAMCTEGTIYPSARYDYKHFMGFWALARDVIVDQATPAAEQIDKLLAPRPFPENYNLAELYSD